MIRELEMEHVVVIVIVLTLLCHLDSGSSFRLELSNDGPVVLGAPVTFKAELLNDSGKKPTGTFTFFWRDDARHTKEQTTSSETCQFWRITYPADKYEARRYEVELSVSKHFLIPIPIISKRMYFNVTSTLNGKMNIIQNNQSRLDSPYVANNRPVNHTIKLLEPDSKFLKQNATQVITYWFVDCIYYGQTDDMNFIFTHNGTDKIRDVEALVVVSFDPLPTPTPPTTTTTTTTTTSTTTTTTTPTTTTPTTTTTMTTTTPITTTSTTTHKPKIHTLPNHIPHLCLNSSVIFPDPNKTVGYFHRRLESRAPVTNVTITGNYWLQHGEMLDLTVNCGGSPPYTRCFDAKDGAYNVTGNETCSSPDTSTSNVCSFPIYRYFKESMVHTIVIIISNDVSNIVHPVTVTIYDVTKNPQLSVVVIPVVFTLVAVILIVFGVAFYIQSKRRFTIEVADFDFGQANDLEYKSFRERLRDAFMDAFPGSAELLDTRSESSGSRAPGRPIWTDRGTPKYGNVESE